MISGYWGFNPSTNKFEPFQREPFSLFPTIVDPVKKIVYCRKCHRWEYIIHFYNNILTTQCGKLYKGPFVRENTCIDYSYNIQQQRNVYSIQIKSQIATINNRRTLENNYALDLDRKIFYKDNKFVLEDQTLRSHISKDVTDTLLEEMGNHYKEQYGIKPTVSSELKGFNLLMGYMLCPFNINFYKIAHHWGLNPYDKNFTDLASGDTPSAENEMFDSLGIRPTKKIRKMYQKFPQSVICYAAMQDLGFTDVNLLQRSANSEVYEFLNHFMICFAGSKITYAIRTALQRFVQDMLAITNEKTVWNSIERTIKFFAVDALPDSIIADGIQTYFRVRELLTEAEKKDVLREGFNTYTHDFLVKRSHDFNLRAFIKNDEKLLMENEFYCIEKPFLDLEYKAGENFKTVYNPETQKEEAVRVEDDDRYCFYVAQDYKTLLEIGSKMHNCVGWGYSNIVAERRATIVYAKYKGAYKICIEVSPKFTILQVYGPCNKPLGEEAYEAYMEWCENKNVHPLKAF